MCDVPCWTAAEKGSLDIVLDFVRGLKPVRVLETGTYEGETAFAIGSVLKDTWGWLDTIEENEYLANVASKRVEGLPVTVHHCSSLDFVPEFPIDLAFLDSGISVRHLEAEHLKSYMSPKGLIFIHDANDLLIPKSQLVGWNWVHINTDRGLLLLQAGI